MPLACANSYVAQPDRGDKVFSVPLLNLWKGPASQGALPVHSLTLCALLALFPLLLSALAP